MKSAQPIIVISTMQCHVRQECKYILFCTLQYTNSAGLSQVVSWNYLFYAIYVIVIFFVNFNKNTYKLFRKYLVFKWYFNIIIKKTTHALVLRQNWKAFSPTCRNINLNATWKQSGGPGLAGSTNNQIKMNRRMDSVISRDCTRSWPVSKK